MALALVNHEGRVLVNETPTTPSQVETSVEESLDVIAAREAARQSTKTKEVK